MGHGNWDAASYTSYSTRSLVGRSTDQVFKAREVNPNLDPKNVVREARDSEDHPESTAIKLGDHTKLPQLVVSTIQLAEGHDIDEITASWDNDVAEVINNSIGGVINFR